MKVTFYFDRMSIAPDGIEIDVQCVPVRGDCISFEGEIGEKIEQWEEEADDVLVVLYVQHTFSDSRHEIRVQCAMDRAAKLF